MSGRVAFVGAAAIVVTVVSALAQFGAPSDLVVAILAPVWLGFPFVLVYAAATRPHVTDRTVWVAFAAAAATTLLVHRIVSWSIQDDPSSTAALAHVYDPLIGAAAVAVVLALAWLARRSRARTAG